MSRRHYQKEAYYEIGAVSLTGLKYGIYKYGYLKAKFCFYFFSGENEDSVHEDGGATQV